MKDHCMEEMKRKLGERLGTLRRERHLTQEELARRARYHPTYVAKIESGERFPSLEAVKSLADALEVPTSYIIGVIDKPGPIRDQSVDYMIDEIVALLQNCTAKQISLVKDFIELLKRYGVGER